MPISGTVWTIKKDKEFLIFNNTRYEESPRGNIKDEYPIKVRVHYPKGHEINFDRIKELLGQVFEFSRIYWKSVRQQSKPVTVSYSEMIANFAAHFAENSIPEN